MWFPNFIIVQYLVVVSDRQRKGSSTLPSGAAVDEDRMMPRHCFVNVPFSASTLMIRWQEGHSAHQNPIPLITRGAFPEKMEEEKPRAS